MPRAAPLSVTVIGPALTGAKVVPPSLAWKDWQQGLLAVGVQAPPAWLGAVGENPATMSDSLVPKP
jgi:hypothetical protein